MNNLNRTIISTEVESVIKSLPTKNSPGPGVFTAEFFQTFQKEFTPILYNLFQTIERETIFKNSLYEANTTLKPKQDRDTTEE